jgi:hypothetical protein
MTPIFICCLYVSLVRSQRPSYRTHTRPKMLIKSHHYQTLDETLCKETLIVSQHEPHVLAIYRCGTFRLAKSRFTILNNPSPNISPLANTMIGVSLLPFHLLHHKLINPPNVRASVKLGVLYIPKHMISSISRKENTKHTNSHCNTTRHEVDPPTTETPRLPVIAPNPDDSAHCKNHSCSASPFLDHGRQS